MAVVYCGRFQGHQDVRVALGNSHVLSAFREHHMSEKGT